MLFLHNVLTLALEAAPWLVLGLLLGGLMKALIPTTLLHKHLRGDGLGSVLKAALLGAPLPLCSCGVIPAAVGLRKAGASKPATTSFLVSTPETGIDSISLTYAMMGGFMALARPIAALFSAIVTGLLVSRFDKEQHLAPLTNDMANEKSHHHEHNHGHEHNHHHHGHGHTHHHHHSEHLDCCDPYEEPNTNTASPSPHFLQQAREGIQYAFSTLLNEIVFWLFIGLLFAAAIQTWLPADFLAQWGHGLVAMLVMLLVGIPMYICATASTPIAAGLIMAGVSPGAALVFLLAGPATNISTLGVISKQLGKRSMLLYLIGVTISAVSAGLLVDVLLHLWQVDMQMALHDDHTGMPAFFAWASLLLLVALSLRNVAKTYQQRLLSLSHTH